MSVTFQPNYLQFDFSKLASREWTGLTTERRIDINKASQAIYWRLVSGEQPGSLVGTTILEGKVHARKDCFDGDFYAGFVWHSELAECGFACYVKKSARKFRVDSVGSGRSTLQTLLEMQVNGVRINSTKM